jgi:hypothetical protein
MDFESLQKLSDPKYCDQLVVITSDIVSKYFNELDVEYLEQRTKQGLEINDMTKDVLMFLTKNHLEDLDIKNDRNKSIKKKRVCIGIAKFYVTIASIYAAIITTINPVYTYKDQNGEVVKKNWSDKNNVPKNAEVKNTNICDDRIQSLSIGINDDDNMEYNDLKPSICSFNNERNSEVLSDEPGISELEVLYYDVYNFSTGKFDSMSPTAKTDYDNDVKLFYHTFTGNNVMSPEITKFSDIPLKNFGISEKCINGKYEPKQVYKNNKLFMAYAGHIKQMIQNATQKQKELTSVLNNLFLPVVDPYTKEKRIRIHPKLTDAILKQQVKKTRETIVQLYSICEEDYLEGMLLYEAIVETKIRDTLINQSTGLDELKQGLINEFRTGLKPVPSPDIMSTNINVPLDNPLTEQTLLPEENTSLETPSLDSTSLPEENPVINPLPEQSSFLPEQNTSLPEQNTSLEKYEPISSNKTDDYKQNLGLGFNYNPTTTTTTDLLTSDYKSLTPTTDLLTSDYKSPTTDFNTNPNFNLNPIQNINFNPNPIQNINSNPNFSPNFNINPNQNLNPNPIQNINPNPL